MAGRKRKADSNEPTDDRMSTSPTASPSASSRTLPPMPRPKRHRTTSQPSAHQPLNLSRLLETLDASDLRTLLTDLCTRHPSLANDLITSAPRPSLDSTLTVLSRYETTFTTSFPFGTRPNSEYSYLRVRSALHALLEALKDFTPQFLPPRETQAGTSLTYLDSVTSIVHRIPDFDSVPAARREKDDAYEELDAAWVVVLKGAGKRAGGMALHMGGWEQRIVRHDHESAGRLPRALEEVRAVMGWYAPGGAASGRTQQQLQAGGFAMGSGGADAAAEERERVRRELLSGMYGAEAAVGGHGGASHGSAQW